MAAARRGHNRRMHTDLTHAHSRGPARRDLLGLAALGLGGAGLLGALGLGGCASLPDEWRLSQAELLAHLVERFPMQRRIGEIVDLKLAAPRIKLRPEDNRVVVGFDAELQETLFSGRRFPGSLAFATGLRYEGSDGTLRLNNVRTETLNLGVLPGRLNEIVERLAGRVVEEVLEGQVVHTFSESLVRRSRQLGLQPGAFKVTDSGVVVRLEPIPR